MTTKKTEENTRPSATKYMDANLHAIIGELGDKFLAMRKTLNSSPSGFDHRDYMWLGELPVYYDDEILGYLRFEDDIVNFYEAELKDES